MSDTSKTKFSNNLIAIAGLITAVGGLLTILNQTGKLSLNTKDEKPQTESIRKTQNTEGQRETIANQNEYNIEKTVPSKSLDQDNAKLVTYDEPENLTFNLTGYWYDTVNSGRYYFNHQSSGNISFQEYSFLEGVWMVTVEGTGTVNGKNLNIAYTTLFGLTGFFRGTIQDNGIVITGTATINSTGVKTPMNLNKEY